MGKNTQKSLSSLTAILAVSPLFKMNFEMLQKDGHIIQMEAITPSH
jgi:hypothetical protein